MATAHSVLAFDYRILGQSAMLTATLRPTSTSNSSKIFAEGHYVHDSWQTAVIALSVSSTFKVNTSPS